MGRREKVFKVPIWIRHFSLNIELRFSTSPPPPTHFTHFALGQRTTNTVAALFMYCSSTIHIFKNIKNGSHDTIYTFKNYFTCFQFSIFNFQQQ